LRKKIFVLDTNVLLHDPRSLFAFEDNEIVLPFSVIEEIDNQKKRQDEIGRNARTTSQELDRLRGKGRLSEGVDLPSGGRIKIELNHRWSGESLPAGMDSSKHDNRILSVAHYLHHSEKRQVYLVTKDLNLRIMADVLGIPAQDFFNDKVDYARLYSGIEEWHTSAEVITSFYREGCVKVDESLAARPNQCIVMRNGSSQSALARFYRGQLHNLSHGDSANFGIRARNKEQRFALEMLLNNTIKVVTMIGRAGTGKTLLAIAVGLEKVVEQKSYARLLITRPVMPIGNDLGYLPGSKEEKLRPWMQPIYDNMELLFSNNAQPNKLINHLIDTDVLEMEALTYIRGRSIPRQFIICDEAQNLSPHMIKTLITRVGEGTKIVFTGDPEQIDHPYLDASSNGLSHLVDRLKDEEIAGHVTLVKGERSPVAEMGARLL
jgi:PhoH-like ATPase